jgi:predicted phosphohydrolase
MWLHKIFDQNQNFSVQYLSSILMYCQTILTTCHQLESYDITLLTKYFCFLYKNRLSNSLEKPLLDPVNLIYQLFHYLPEFISNQVLSVNLQLPNNLVQAVIMGDVKKVKQIFKKMSKVTGLLHVSVLTAIK